MKFVLPGGSGQVGTVIARARIHHYDFVRAVRWLVEHDDLAGAVNLASAQSVARSRLHA